MSTAQCLKVLVQRIECSGDTSPGAFNLAADLLHIVMSEADGWTTRLDDAMRIPGMIEDLVRGLKDKAKSVQ